MTTLPESLAPGWGAASPVAWPAFVAEILATYEPPIRARLTHAAMRSVLARVGELLGEGASTDALTPELVARFVASRPAGLSPNTVAGDVARLRAACSYAEARRYIVVSPFRLRRQWVRKAPASAESRRHQSREEIARVLERARFEVENTSGWPQWRARRTEALVNLFAFTGLRKMEGLGLLVEDVDLVERMILLVPRGRGFKTEGSAQPVPMARELAEVLAAWLPHAGGKWLFPNALRSGPWRQGSAANRPLDRLKALGERAGVAGLTFKSLRHSWATHAESLWGLSEPMIQRVLRHTTPLTQRHYRHADLANLRRATEGISFGEPGHGQA